MPIYEGGNTDTWTRTHTWLDRWGSLKLLYNKSYKSAMSAVVEFCPTVSILATKAEAKHQLQMYYSNMKLKEWEGFYKTFYKASQTLFTCFNCVSFVVFSFHSDASQQLGFYPNVAHNKALKHFDIWKVPAFPQLFLWFSIFLCDKSVCVCVSNVQLLMFHIKINRRS